MIELPSHISVQESLITFTATPENIILSSQVMGGLSFQIQNSAETRISDKKN